MMQERNLEYIAERHAPILAAAAMEGVDVSPAIGGATRLIGYGSTKHGYGPACILDITSTDYVMEPHIIWLPWTSVADRVAHFKWAMELMSQTHQVLMNVEKKYIKFFEHFVKKGLLRKIGYIDNLPIVEEVHMYQYQRRKA